MLSSSLIKHVQHLSLFDVDMLCSQCPLLSSRNHVLKTGDRFPPSDSEDDDLNGIDYDSRHSDSISSVLNAVGQPPPSPLPHSRLLGCELPSQFQTNSMPVVSDTETCSGVIVT